LIEAAAKAAPANPYIQYHLGVVYAAQGRKVEARRALEAAVSTKDFADAEQARKLLSGL
jgi:Flp pilus assembly protein TadD